MSASPKPADILVTSAAAKAPLIRAMQGAARRLPWAARVIAGDVDPDAPARHVADGFWAMPRLAETTAEALLEACVARGVGLILPTRDGELAFWAAARARFAEAGIEVVVSPPAAVQRTLDKLAFAAEGARRGLAVIPAAATPDGLGPGPFVVKARFGAGARDIGLKLDRDAALAHAARLADPIYQPFVAGPEISIDGWMDALGEPRGVVLRRRDRVVGGESQVTTTFRDAWLEAEAAHAFRALDLRGPAVLQAILTEGGRLSIIECNARFGGASTAAIAVGLDLLYWSLAQHWTPRRRPSFQRLAGEVRQVRLAQDIIVHDPDL